jgi:dephospho-CoA kinase
MDRERTQSDRHILGLTGPIACGKTTVGNILLELGATERIDADTVVHRLMVAGTPTTRRIVERFGDDILAEDGSVDRRALAGRVFGDPSALRDLEAITHPEVRLETLRRLQVHSEGVIVIDAVKLLQSELLPLCDAVWVVRCDPEVELRRLKRRNGLTKEEAQTRIAAQPSFDSPAVGVVIDNSGSVDELRRHVEEAWSAELRKWTA